MKRNPPVILELQLCSLVLRFLIAPLPLKLKQPLTIIWLKQCLRTLSPESLVEGQGFPIDRPRFGALASGFPVVSV